MPWTPSDAHGHTHKAPVKGKTARQWSHVANSVLERTGDEGLAIREANGVVRKHGLEHASHVQHSRSGR